jgi:Acetyltransferase (GNAT) family
LGANLVKMIESLLPITRHLTKEMSNYLKICMFVPQIHFLLMSVTITRVASDADVQGILDLQQKNLKKNISIEIADSQGFVTVEHTFEVLKKMNDASPSIIAKDGETVVGYAIVMLPEFRKAIPVLEGLFEAIEQLSFKNKPMTAYRYVVIGQLCVGEGYRGIGLVNSLYNYYKKSLENDFDFCITDISSKNPRSRKAHEKVGFQVVKSFFDDISQETWDIVLWDWTA